MKTPTILQKTSVATALIAVLLAPMLSGCVDNTPAASRPDSGSGAVAAATDHHADSSEKRTDFTEKTELFVEFPSLVVGQPATFVAHLTRLADFKPITKGQVTVVLAGGSAPEERFVAEVSAVPGIFKPVVTPTVAGERELKITLDADLGTQTHVLGPITIFANAAAAKAARVEQAQDDGGITFTKEQQWKIDFATVEATTGLVRPSVKATASIKAQPDGEAQIAAPTAGILRAAGKFPHIGQFVRKGQVLATLIPRLGGETDQASLDAAATKARIALDHARRERERMEALFRDEAIPEKRLIEARANEQLAMAESNAARARAAQTSGGAGIAIRAPIDGTIAHVAVSSGTFVAEGNPLFHVANTKRLWLETRVPESDIGRLGTPTGASFTVDGFDHTFTIDERNGRLIAVGGIVDAATRTVPVVFEFANPGNTLRLGMAASAQLFAGSGTESVLVPASAVQDESGTQAVYVLTSGESFQRRIVQTGARDGDHIAILSGLEPGLRVVSKGAYLIRLSTSMTGPSGHAH